MFPLQPFHLRFREMQICSSLPEKNKTEKSQLKIWEAINGLLVNFYQPHTHNLPAAFYWQCATTFMLHRPPVTYHIVVWIPCSVTDKRWMNQWVKLLKLSSDVCQHSGFSINLHTMLFWAASHSKIHATVLNTNFSMTISSHAGRWSYKELKSWLYKLWVHLSVPITF